MSFNIDWLSSVTFFFVVSFIGDVPVQWGRKSDRHGAINGQY